MRYGLTPSQTVGPYLHIGFEWLSNTQLASADTPGEPVVIVGQLVDAEGVAVPDGVIEIWQADTQGVYAHAEDRRAPTPGFTGFGRCATDAEGRFAFSTIKPGRVPAVDGGLQAPHMMVNVFARGLLKQLVTRMYFPGDEHGNDFVLNQVPAARRSSLIAKADPDNEQRFLWQIALAGGNETVFFEI
ncbi:MAG: protocatechuate 3,4-dioxygenase subunit alpha [Betaproteobacteria bacterium]|nr:protocatechuate 3,4-dioxygenase subunit alpha [Betaproteobacteria bacterium]